MSKGTRTFFGFGKETDPVKHKRNLIITGILLIIVIVFVALTYDKGPLIDSQETSVNETSVDDSE